MSKVTIEMDMPECCDECPLQTRENTGESWKCAVTESRINGYSQTRRNIDCPLKEV